MPQKLQFLLECESASNHVEKSTTSSAAAAPAHPNTLDFQIKLERYLRGTNHSTEDPRKTEEVCLWIKVFFWNSLLARFVLVVVDVSCTFRFHLFNHSIELRGR